MPSPPALALRGLTKRYDAGLLALDDVDLTVPDGAFFGVLGPNGAGKTTRISAVCNLTRVTHGDLPSSAPRTVEARRMTRLAEQDINLDRFLDSSVDLLAWSSWLFRTGRRLKP